MRTKDRPTFLRRALSSVLAQTLQNWFVVVVNDGGAPEPVDELVSELSARLKQRIKVIHHLDSIGMEAAANRGARASRSKYITVHDDDDSWEPTFLEKCVGSLEAQQNSSFAGVITHWWRIMEDDAGLPIAGSPKQSVGPDPLDVGLYFFSTPTRNFPPISFLFRRDVFEAIGGFVEGKESQADFEFNLRFLQHADIMVHREALANYHLRPLSQNVLFQNDSNRSDALARGLVEMRGRFLRADLKKGSFGLGGLLALSHDQFVQQERIKNFIGDRATEIQSFLGEVKSQVDCTRVQVDVMRSQTDALRPPIDAIRPHIDKMREQVDHIRPHVDSMLPQMDAMRSQIDSMRPQVDSMRPQLDSIKPHVDVIRQQTDVMRPHLDVIRTQVDCVRPQVDEIRSQVDQTRTEIMSLAGTLARLENRLSDLEVLIVGNTPWHLRLFRRLRRTLMIRQPQRAST